MAALALGLAGSAIGGAIGGTFLGVSASAVGWMAGSVLGSYLTQQDTNSQGARLGDLTVQASTYGTMVPVVHGALRVSGNVIWSSEKREVATTTDVGKGGPSASVTNYTYSVDMALALADGQMSAIRKIWSNGKLIYDVSAGGDAATVVASETRSAAFRFYPGSETQLPDPTIEAALGAGNVPAYRGTCYVVFERLDCPNSQVPQMQFELLSESTQSVNKVTYTTITQAAGTASASISPDGIYQIHTGTTTIGAVRYGALGNQSVYSFVQPAAGFNVDACITVGGSAKPEAARRHSDDQGVTTLQVVSLDTGTTQTIGIIGNAFTGVLACTDPVDGRYLLAGSSGIAEVVGGLLPALSLAAHDAGNHYALRDGQVFNSFVRAGTVYLRTYGPDGSVVSELAGPYHAAYLSSPITLVQPTDGGVYVFVRANKTTPTGRAEVYRVRSGVWTLLCGDADVGVASLFTSWHCNDRYCILGPVYGDTLSTYTLVDFSVVSFPGVPVSQVLSDYCVRAGLDVGQIDVGGVSGVLHGAAVTRMSTARAALQPVMTAWFIDAVETDGKLKFFERASVTPSASVPFDQLGCAEDVAMADALLLRRQQEAELPASLSLSYINSTADYLPGTESARRNLTRSINDQSLEIPIAMSPDHAATVAVGLLYNLWNERTLRTTSVTRAYAAIDPGDVVLVEYPVGSWQTMRTKSTQDKGTVVDVEFSPADPMLLVGDVPGASLPNAQVGLQPIALTRAEILDLPMLRSQDDDAGLYVALHPLSGSWSGASLFMGQDLASLSIRGSVSVAAVTGFAATVLPTWSGSIMDQANTVDVQLSSGVLYSVSRDAVLDQFANAAVIGSELVQFMTATHLGNNLYRLSGFLRGQRGTDHSVASHAVGDKFVLLNPASLVRVPMDTADIGAAREWRAVTTGRAVAQAAKVSKASTGISLKPFAPVNLRRAYVAGTDLRYMWDRRTRSLQTFPASSVDVPLGEASELYEIEIFNGLGFSSVLRTVQSTVADFTYTAAQQIADFGVTQSSISVRIYQIGRAGRGYSLQGTL